MFYSFVQTLNVSYVSSITIVFIFERTNKHILILHNILFSFNRENIISAENSHARAEM